MRIFKIFFLTNFQTYNAVLTIVTLLSTHLRTSLSCKWKFVPFYQHLPISLTPQPQATIVLLSASLSLAFLDSTYKWDHIVFVFVWLISLRLVSSRPIHVVISGKISFFFQVDFIPLYIFTTFSLSILLLTRHLGCLCLMTIVNNATSEHGGTDISLRQWFHFLWMYTQEWNCWVMWQFYSYFFEQLPLCFPQWLYKFIFPPTGHKCSLFSTSSPILVITHFFFWW